MPAQPSRLAGIPYLPRNHQRLVPVTRKGGLTFVPSTPKGTRLGRSHTGTRVELPTDSMPLIVSSLEVPPRSLPPDTGWISPTSTAGGPACL